MDDEKHVEGRMKGEEWNWKEGEGGMDDEKHVEGRMKGIGMELERGGGRNGR